MFSSDGLTKKALATREAIRAAALESFRTRGYDATTLRLIAADARVSLGNTYNYFPTKHHLVQELYLEATGAFHEQAATRLEGVSGLVDRLRTAYRLGLEVLEPYHALASGFVTAAVTPDSPVNPLSSESSDAREQAVAVWRLVVDGARDSLPAWLATRLPDVLQLGYLLVSLFWVYDRSPEHRRTLAVLDSGLALFRLGLPVLRTPLVRGPLERLLVALTEVAA